MSFVSPLKNLDRELARFHGRLKVGAAFVLLLAAALLARTYYLQIGQNDFYIQRAESNRISQVPTPPNRGLILDRKDRILAENYSAYTLELTRAQTGDLEATLAEVAKLIEITPVQLRRFRRLLAESHEFETVPLKSKLTDEEVAILAANRYRLPGVEVKARLFRNYRAGPSMAHVVGFIGRINDADVKRLRKDGREEDYSGSTHIGKTGLEQSYEALLHGRTGFDQMETDASGRAVRMLSRIPPVPGKDLRLYLDVDLQEVAEHAFGEYLGGLVALDPNTGGVLALVSKPGFDPNVFVDGIDPETWKSLNESPEKPMVNRVLRGIYPPGSTIKPLMALAGLELGVRNACRSASPIPAISACPTAATSSVTGSAAGTAASTCAGRSRSRATSTTTSWRWTWASTACTTTSRSSASAKKPASTWTASRPACCLRPTGSSAAASRSGIPARR